MLGEQFIPGGPYLTLYDYKEGQWVQLMGWHHCTMYFFFGLMAFVLYNHTHGREILDIFVHQLLVLIVFLAGLVAFIELFIHANITIELLRISLILLQGSWFFQIGFVLYPLNGGPAWDLVDHDNIMFLTICVCWHYAFTIIIIGAIYAFVTWGWAASKNNGSIQGTSLPPVSSLPEPEEDYCLFLFQKPSDP
ncbi:transmembrane protein 45A [Camelus ferus]|nr:transmembrane protein 45A [Camelus ferus]